MGGDPSEHESFAGKLRETASGGVLELFVRLGVDLGIRVGSSSMWKAWKFDGIFAGYDLFFGAGRRGRCWSVSEVSC